MVLREEVPLKLLQINAIRLSPQNPFTWASGIISPIYCDNRIALSYPKVRNLITRGFDELSAEFGPYDYIAGVATAGIAHGALLAHVQELPFVYVRATAKAHGRQNRIEGHLAGGSSVIVVEDLISTGGSSIEAVNAIRDAGCEVKAVLAIFQYNFAEAKERFEEAGCAFRTLSDYETLVDIAERQNTFDHEQLRLLRSWHTDPRGWMQSENSLNQN